MPKQTTQRSPCLLSGLVLGGVQRDLEALNGSVKTRGSTQIESVNIVFTIFQGTGEHEHVTEAQLHGVALCTANDVIEDTWHSK